MATETSPQKPVQTSTWQRFVQRWKVQLLLLASAAATALAAFFIGRRNRKGEIDIKVAAAELAAVNAKAEKKQKELDVLRQKQQDVLVDIVAEEARRLELTTKESTDAEVLARLRADGLIK